MATIDINAVTRSHGRVRVSWVGLGNADDGVPFEPPAGYVLDSMQFTGTLGGATLLIEGSNDDQTTFNTLKSETGLGFAIPESQALAFRAATSGGTGTVVNAYALFQARS